MKITNETRVLITGANGGLGVAIARAFARAGAQVIASGRREDALAPLRDEHKAELALADLSQRADVQRLAQTAQACDVLVLNAALPASGPLLVFDAEQIDRALDVNLRAPIQLARVAAEAMLQRGRGHIVLISSISGKVAVGGTSLYSATKFGMRGFGLGLREDLRKGGVGVSTIFPGLIRDAGLFAMTGVKLPAMVGTRSPENVADAVMRAVRNDVAEIDVAAFEQRLGGWLAPLFPGLISKLQRMGGGERIAGQIIEGQRLKR